MDDGCHHEEDDHGQLIFSSLPQELFNVYGSSFSVEDSGSAPCLTHHEMGYYLEQDDPRSIDQQLYQAYMSMEKGFLFAEDFIQQQQVEELFPPDQSHHSSSASSVKSLADNNSTIPTNEGTQSIPAVVLPLQVSMQAHNRYIEYPHFSTLSSDDEAITKAMAAVISSSSSSSSSPCSSMSYQPLQQAEPHQTQSIKARVGAFNQYNSAPNLAFESDKNSCSQKVMKTSISMLRRTNSSPMREESPPPSIQLQHIISERKRREKLNDSFAALTSLLPPGSKKDKASVLINTRNYLNTLKAQISKLEEENRVLEMHLSATEQTKEVDGSMENVKFRRIKGVKSNPGVQQIEYKISVRVGCDMIDSVLDMLECLKEMGFTSLMSFDANMLSKWMDLFMQATLKLEVKASDWDEDWFKEAISRAVDIAMVTP